MKVKDWLKQTSTKTALGGLLMTGAGLLTGEMSTTVALGTAIPILYGLAVHDKGEAPTR